MKHNLVFFAPESLAATRGYKTVLRGLDRELKREDLLRTGHEVGLCAPDFGHMKWAHEMGQKSLKSHVRQKIKLIISAY